MAASVDGKQSGSVPVKLLYCKEISLMFVRQHISEGIVPESPLLLIILEEL